MLKTFIDRLRIADKLFYIITGLLVLVLGGFGSIIIYQRMSDARRNSEEGIKNATTYLQHVLPQAVFHLDAKRIRQDIENSASVELQAVEIFDADGEQIYVYTRASSNIVYDRTVEEELSYGGNPVGRMILYFSSRVHMQSLRTRELLQLLLLISAAGLSLAFALNYVVNRIIVRPISATLAFSESIAAGDYTKRIQTTTGDEMGQLQKSLNRMADYLYETVEQLKASFYEAEKARHQALEASRLKSEFLSTLSHEIRTPINAIVGFSELLLENEGNRARKNQLALIKDSAGMLLDNINDILDISKLEAGKIILNTEAFSLPQLIDEITPIVKLRLSGKDVVFKTSISYDLKPFMDGDRNRLRQVLLNILINAAKFTHRGKIELAVRPSGDGKTLFAVSDTGIGIPEEDHERVFEPFTQVDSTIKREYGGVGLGLSIARELVELMGGNIRLESSPGKGSTFSFEV